MKDSHTPLLIVLAGINGAGKSSFYDEHLQRLGLPFVNADQIARQEWPEAPDDHAYDTGRRAEEIRDALLARHSSFVTETVFSHPSKVELMRRARNAGYRVMLIYIHLQAPELAVLRVSERVQRGGHPVPPEKIGPRFSRLLENLAAAARVVDDVVLYDNSFVDEPFRYVATLKRGHLVHGPTDLPVWAARLDPDTV